MGYRWDGFRKPRNQVMKRIRERITKLGLNSLDEYRYFLEQHPGEWEKLDGLMNVTISRFFRDRKLWDLISDKILPELSLRRPAERMKVWSAGCCNGEEPYSIAIAAEKAGLTGRISVQASDRNQQVLKRAEEGRYPPGALKELTEEEKRSFFYWDEKKELYSVGPTLKETVQFELRDISVRLPGQKFDLIFCRNLVFTYFSREKQRSFLDEIQHRLNDNGFLIIGANESLPDEASFRNWNQSVPVYKKQSLTDLD
jgi:chemotaxis protein methyltransferase CheR